jgi:glycosyl transferase family 25
MLIFILSYLFSNNKENYDNKPDKSLCWDFIDKIVYINLDESKDRRYEIEETLSTLPQNKIIRFPAIKDEVGHIGCSKSHIEILKLAIKNNWKNVLILEDDIMWSNLNSYKVLINIINNNKKYDVICFGGSKVQLYKNFKLNSCSAATSYLVNNHYYKTLLNNFEEGLKNLINTQIFSRYCIDQYWKKLQQKDNWHIVHPALIIQKPTQSIIEKKYVNYSKLFNINDKQVKFLH